MFEKLIDRIVDEVCRRVVPEMESMFSEHERNMEVMKSDIIESMAEVAEQEQRVSRISREVADAVVQRFRV